MCQYLVSNCAYNKITFLGETREKQKWALGLESELLYWMEALEEPS